MKQWYKMVYALVMAAGVASQVNAQTHYGTAVGTIGEGHVFLGNQAGSTSVDAYNTFIGSSSGQYHINGARGTFVGYRSGQNENNGVDNTLIGAFSGHNLTGFNNTFVGSKAGELYKGNYSILLGNLAGAKAIGQNNIILGNGTGYQFTGDANVFIGGMTASMFNTKSEQNTMVGYEAGTFNENSTNNAFFGASSGRQNKTGSHNAFFGRGSGYNNINGNYISCFGFSAGAGGTNGQNNTFIGAFTGTGLASNLTNATAIGAEALVTASNSVVLGKNANVGIGISAPSFQLHLSLPGAAKPGSSTWIVWSDQRLKKDISDFTDGLDLLKQIKPVWFRYNGEAGIKTDQKFVGVIAQDMQKIAPYTVGSTVYEDSLGKKTEYLDYDANAVTYLLINSVKEQQVIIEQKEAKIQEVSAQVTELTKRLEQLERIIASGPLKPIGNPAAKLGSEPNENGVVLEQNAPNGFSQNTLINFFIPQSVKDAVVNIYSTEGVKVGSYPVTDRGQSALKLSAKTFRSGVFIYDLVTDGKSNGAKKMVVTE